MGKLALGLTLITLFITIFFLAIMVGVGIIEKKDLRQLKKVVIPSNEKRFRKRGGNTPPF